MRSSCLLLCALSIGLGAHAARPVPAAACSFPPNSLTARDTPANGVVIVRSFCALGACFGGELPDELSVIDVVTGDGVPGEIVRKAGALEDSAAIAWRPAQPLTAGRSYEVTWRPADIENELSIDLEFEALPATTWSADDLVVVPNLWLATGSLDTVSCESNVPDTCGGGGGPSAVTIWLSERSYAALAVQIDLASAPEGIVDLYAVSAAFFRSGDARPPLEEADWLRGSRTEHAFFEAADEYCFQVQITSLVDDSVAEHEGCVPHGSLGALRTMAVPDVEIATTLQSCEIAPEGLERLWCKGWSEHCAMREGGVCDTLDAKCSEFDAPAPAPTPVEPQPTPRPTEAVDPSDPGEPSQPAMNMTGEPGQSANTRTCSASPGAQGRCAFGPLALFGAALALLGRRRRRQLTTPAPALDVASACRSA